MRNLLTVAMAMTAMFSCGEGYNATMFLEEGYATSENDAVAEAEEDIVPEIDGETDNTPEVGEDVETDNTDSASEVGEDLVPEVGEDIAPEVGEDIEMPVPTPELTVQLLIKGALFTADAHLVYLPEGSNANPYELTLVPCDTATIATGCSLSAHVQGFKASSPECPMKDWEPYENRSCYTDPIPVTEPSESALVNEKGELFALVKFNTAVVQPSTEPKDKLLSGGVSLTWTLTDWPAGQYALMVEGHPKNTNVIEEMWQPSWPEIPASAYLTFIGGFKSSVTCGNTTATQSTVVDWVDDQGKAAPIHSELFWEGPVINLPSCIANQDADGTLYTWNAELGNWQKIN